MCLRRFVTLNHSHEYETKDCLTILKHLVAAMQGTPGSKMIINEALPSRPFVVPASSTNAPSENIPPKQSRLADTANTMTLDTFLLFGGKERSYEEYEPILVEAGLKISRFFPFRSFTVMIECEIA